MIKADLDGHGEDTLGIYKMIQSVEVSEYQKKRYLIFLIKVIVPIFKGIKGTDDLIDFIKVRPVVLSVTRSWNGYRLKKETRDILSTVLINSIGQYNLYIATKGDYNEKQHLLRAINWGKTLNGILSNNIGFNEAIEQIINSRSVIDDHIIHQGENKTKQSDESLAKVLQERKEKIFKKPNQFNNMSLEMVYNHFIILAQNKSKGNNEPFLTEKQVLDFIEMAFLNLPHDPISINIIRGEYQKIIYHFYRFFLYVRTKGISLNMQEKVKYVNLLKKHCSFGTNSDIYSNFSKKPCKILPSPLWDKT